MTTIQKGSFLTLHYRLCGPDGAAVVNTFDAQPATLTLGAGQLAPAIEARLLGLAEGAQASFELAPGEAFGQRNPQLLQKVRLALLRELGDAQADYQVGDVVEFPTPDGQGRYAGVLRERGPAFANQDAPDAADEGAWLLFDFNHPLAGQPLRFDVQIIGVL